MTRTGLNVASRLAIETRKSSRDPRGRRSQSRPFRRPGRRLTLLVSAVVVMALMMTGCERTVPTQEEREAVEKVVIAYLHDLARAYSSLDANELSEHATLREMVEVNDLLGRIAASGDRMEATMLQVDFTKIEVFRAVNATAKTIEVWDVARFDAYNGKQKARNPGVVQHAIIQLRQVEGAWKVIGRRVMETQRGGAPVDPVAGHQAESSAGEGAATEPVPDPETGPATEEGETEPPAGLEPAEENE